MHKLILFFSGLLSIQALFAQYKPVFSYDNLYSKISYLASDSLKGRKPGTPEDSLSAFFIRSEFKNNGAIPIIDHGFQNFSVITDAYPGKNNYLTFNNVKLVFKQDFFPASFSASDSLMSIAVFAGYGFDIQQDSIKWNDYEGIDVKGKWVIAFKDKPTGIENIPFDKYSKDRNKALTAKDKGAKGLILIAPTDTKLLSSLSKFDKTVATAGIPVFYISWKAAENLLKREGFILTKLKSNIKENKKPVSLHLKASIKGNAEIIQVKSKTQNVVVKIEGSDPTLKNEYLIIGAHYDHLGMGGHESGSRKPDTLAVHNGADDNASGVGGIIELAGAFAASPVKPKRSLIFVAFGAEEMGMLGSKEFVNNSPVDLKFIKGMFNFDMIGRMKKDNPKLSIGGTGTSEETDSLISLLEKDLPFTIAKSPEGYGPSDHAAFYKNNIPVFFFITGIHDDYHTPFDDIEKLDIQQEVKILDFAYSLIELVANKDKALTFKESGSKEESTSRSFKISLGIIPDVVGSSEKGMGVDGVKKGGPAELAGILKGDIIISVNDLPVTNVYDYMARLNTLKKGQKVKIEVLRNGKTEILFVQL